MADTYKRLGAEEIDGSGNAVTTNIELYVVGGGTETIVSSINICNRSANVGTIRVAHIDGALGDIADEDYIIYDETIEAKGHITIQLGISMEAADTLLCRSDIVDINFIAWGLEKT
ncbi:hypothetical protein CMI37_31020 [Candidatus Pacearchaeota archaeon]|nr:hypothetical protein [Candidatus Pacearchaeota archaeon]|tara:strand:- start:2506 stop:2853 length:348 start_codon:yes stop_codon:yes gene_type:complete